MIQVKKANGQLEPFSDDKLRFSIHRAGIPSDLEKQVVDHINAKLYEGIPTSEIYRHITEFLKSTPTPHASARYSLKQSIMALGPTGYPFEDYISEIMKKLGYKTIVRSILQGKCVTHEIDVLAEKDGKKIMVEAKFHNNPGIYTDVHVSLYTKARFDDIQEKYNLSQAWIVTNTKVTSDASAFAQCSGMKTIAWDYPTSGSLRDQIEDLRLFPITTLTTLSFEQKRQLLENHVVLCSDIVNDPTKLILLELPKEKREEIVKEATLVVEK